MNLTLFIKNVFAMPTMSTLPVITLLSIYLNTFYELMGSPLSYIRYAIVCTIVYTIVCTIVCTLSRATIA